MTSLCLYIDVVRGKGVFETVEIREYESRPAYIPRTGDYIVRGRTTYHVIDRRTSFSEVSGGPDCFLTLHVEELQESRLKRLWSRLRGHNRKRLEP